MSGVFDPNIFQHNVFQVSVIAGTGDVQVPLPILEGAGTAGAIAPALPPPAVGVGKQRGSGRYPWLLSIPAQQIIWGRGNVTVEPAQVQGDGYILASEDWLFGILSSDEDLLLAA